MKSPIMKITVRLSEYAPSCIRYSDYVIDTIMNGRIESLFKIEFVQNVVGCVKE